MLLSEEIYEELDAWMEESRRLGDKYPALRLHMINANYPIFRDFYVDRGINPSGDPILGNDVGPVRY